jgi:tetratricopeptide (TPR) repeat protein/predicted Ser/Thr protein kinase
MDDDSSGSGTASVREGAASGEVPVVSGSGPAESSQESDATIIAPAVSRTSGSAPNQAGAKQTSASQAPASQPSIGQAPEKLPDANQTIVSAASGMETIVSGAPIRSAPARMSETGSGAAGSGAAGSVILEIGTVLGGRYELLQLLGQGGMGAVYKAADREVDRVVAVKVIRPEMAANPEILARFKQELLLSSQVTDRNVIRIYDLGDAQGVKFITMEYVEGENLHTLLKQRGKLEVAEAVDIMEQVVSGLAAAHRQGIIHRDLKPANIMRDKSGRVVVMDFGLARTFTGDGMTQSGMMLGTMEYMSPEQAQGLDVKASSDIFTVGLILYELLAGIAPFHAESAIASLLMRSQRRASPLIEIDKNIPASLSDIVAKCLDTDPLKRYPSAVELDEDLCEWQGKTVVRAAKRITTAAAAPAVAGARAKQARKLKPLHYVLAGLVVAAAAGGVSWYVIGKHRAASAVAHSPVSVLIGDFANHTGDSVLDNTLEPMLGVAMEGASFINVYSRGDARKLAKKLPNPTDTLDEQSSRLVAMNQGVNAVITGDISLRGDQYDITAIALDSVSGKVLAKADVAVANKQAILSELPKLAVPIRQALGDTTPASIQFEKVSGGFTAASLEAVHQDSLGVEEQFAGKFQDAFDSFQKSAQLDPKFARAYSGMAAMAQNLGRPGDAVKYMKMAMANVDRMTERERYRNQGLYYLTTGDWQNCVQQYTQLVDRYPADRVGQNNLANCYTQLRNAPKALEAARHAVEIVPRGVGQRLNLAFISVFAGDFTAGEKEARTSLEISPTASQGYLVLAESQLGRGQVQEAAASFHQLEKFGALGQSTAADGLADLAAYQGNYAEASRILTQGVQSDTAAKMPENAARKYATLARLELLQGHNAAALAGIARALAANQSIQIQFLAGNIYIEGGDLAKAQKIAAALAAQTSSEPQAYGKILQGLIALKRKDAKTAVAQITAANSLLDTWIGHYQLGQADLEAGAFQQAEAEFDQCFKRRGEVIELFDDNVPTYSYFPPVDFYQGRARQGMKSPNAADSFKAYLAIRGQSTEDPLVAEARHAIGQ